MLFLWNGREQFNSCKIEAKAQFGSAHRSGLPEIAASKAMRDFWEEEPPSAKASIALPGDARTKPSAATKGPRGRGTAERKLKQ